MLTRTHPYTPTDRLRKRRPWSAAAFAALGAITVAGCASVGLGDYAGSTPAVAATPGANGVDRSDWDSVRRALAETPLRQAARHAWTNPRTGSSGHVTVLALADDATCRPFATSINDQRGVRQYRGDACLRNDGAWELLAISADDAQLL